MKQEEAIDFQVRWAWHKIIKMYNAEASNYGLSMAIGQVLLNIDKEGTPSTKLGPKMGMEPRSLTRMLKSLEDKGLIYKQTDESDKRTVRVYLTEEGKKKRKLTRKTVLQFNKFMRDNISRTKMKHFFEVLTKISELIDENDIYKK
ncbi:MAG TPA: MarR family transcriptional regulator [Flavobacteriales bacterium]|nr:MarR family transcriptional regulator [Crocinitomicaceae bacterium]HAE31445.1 MarR family transcriptional regulator [Flavobacteriales bacterium]